MVQIKGTAFKEAVEQVKAHAGRDAFENILGQLDTESRKIIESDLFSSNWYSLDLFARFLEVQNRVLAGGNEEMIIRGAEAANERQLRGVYKAFVKVGSPEFVIERLAAVHATYFQGVSIEVQLQGKGKALIKYVGFQKQHRIVGLTIIGFFKKALELSGAKDVLTHFSTPIEEGKGYSVLSVAWS